MSERKPCPTAGRHSTAADSKWATQEAALRWTRRIMLLVSFLRVNQLFEGTIAVDAGARSLTSHCGTPEGRLLLPFPLHPFRFRPLQDPVIASWNFSSMTVNIFFQVHLSDLGLTQLSGLGVGNEEVQSLR